MLDWRIYMSRTQLMAKLNQLLGTNYNWSRLNKLDLERLVTALNQKFS
jgi:hypothetical protein